jgi:hypothetical protein
MGMLGNNRPPCLSTNPVNKNHVKTFLSKRFTVDNLINGIEPASYVDFDR